MMISRAFALYSICVVAAVFYLSTAAPALGAGQAIQGRSMFTIVENGKARCSIVVSAQATEKERLAADELQTYLEKMVQTSHAKTPDARLPVVTDDLDVPGPRILIGHNRFSEKLGILTAGLGLDGYVIRVTDCDLVLLGDTDQGTLNAVYGLLEDYLGVRWFMPGDLGEDVPYLNTIAIPQIDERKMPDFWALAGLIFVPTPGAFDWERRNRAFLGPEGWRNFDHNWCNIIPPTTENLEAHPAWFALDSQGRRVAQLCTTNPEVIDITVERIVEYFKNRPEVTTFSLAPDDSTGDALCHCERCRALDSKLGITDGSVTDRLLVYCNEVAVRLKAIDPKFADKRLGFLAYQNYTRPPHTVKADDMVAVLVCFMSWDYCYDHAFDDSRCKTNQSFLGWVEGWTNSAKYVGVYYYTGLNEYSFPYPIWDVLPNHIETFKRMGVDMMFHEAQQHWASQSPLYYLAAKLSWNANLDLESFWKDYYDRMYGPAAEPMRKYWDRWIKAMNESGVCGGHGWGTRVCTPEVVDECQQHLSEAYESIGTDSVSSSNAYWALMPERDKIRRRLDFAGVSLKYSDLWSQMYKAYQEKDYDRALAFAERNIKHVVSAYNTHVPQPFVHWTTVRKLLEQERIILQSQLGATTNEESRAKIQSRIDGLAKRDIGP